MTKKSNKVLMIYYDNSVLVDALSNEEAGKVFKSLFRVYAENGEPLEMSGEARMVFLSISNTIKRQIADYDERNERRSQAKKAYWESKKNEEPKIAVENHQ